MAWGSVPFFHRTAIGNDRCLESVKPSEFTQRPKVGPRALEQPVHLGNPDGNAGYPVAVAIQLIVFEQNLFYAFSLG